MNSTTLTLLCSLCLAAPSLQAGPQIESTLSDLFSAFGILVWTFEIPDDLQDGETIRSCWNVQGEFQRVDPGLDFHSIPAGTTTTVWVKISNPDAQIPDDGVEYVIRYKNSSGKAIQRRGTFQVPAGFPDVYGFAPTGSEITVSEGHLLYLSRPDQEGLSILNLEYRSNVAAAGTGDLKK